MTTKLGKEEERQETKTELIKRKILLEATTIPRLSTVIIVSLAGVCMFAAFRVLWRPGVVRGEVSRRMAGSIPYQSGTHSVAFVTVPNEETGKKFAHALVEQKLAACVNIVPKLTSIYEWEGKIEEDSESMMVIKTRASRVDEISEFIRKNHPNEVAEVISMPIENGNQPYLDWLSNIVQPKKA